MFGICRLFWVVTGGRFLTSECLWLLVCFWFVGLWVCLTMCGLVVMLLVSLVLRLLLNATCWFARFGLDFSY